MYKYEKTQGFQSIILFTELFANVKPFSFIINLYHGIQFLICVM